MASLAQAFDDRVWAAETRVEIVRSKARFLALGDPWDGLAAVHGGALSLHDWYAAALEALGTSVRLNVVLVWRDEELAAAVPLAAPALGPTRLCPLDTYLGEPDRILYRDAAALQALAQAIFALGLPVVIRRMPVDDDIDSALSAGWTAQALVVRRNRRASAFVDLPASLQEFEAGMSGKRKSTLRRKKRAAEREEGPVRTELVVPGPYSIEAPLRRLLAIEGAGWKGRAGTSIEDDPRFRRFIHELARRFARNGACKIAFLRIGNNDAAGRLMLEHRSVWHEIKIGYDERFARYSPGLLLMNEVFRLACERRVKRYEFLGLREDWQSFWPNRARYDEFLAIYPRNAGGLRAFGADVLNLSLRAIRRGAGRFVERLRKRGQGK